MKIELITREEYLKRTSYWIHKYELSCGVCGKDMVKEWTRVYDKPRPDAWEERHKYDENAMCYGCY